VNGSQVGGKAVVTPRESGATLQSWLWAPPTKHSRRQIDELLERIATLYELGVVPTTTHTFYSH